MDDPARKVKGVRRIVRQIRDDLVDQEDFDVQHLGNLVAELVRVSITEIPADEFHHVR